MRAKRILGAAAGLAGLGLFASGLGHAQTAAPPDLGMADRDGPVVQQEFLADPSTRSVYDLLDNDDSGRIEPEEFTTSVFDRSHHDAWDMDRDGYLTEDEFVTGIYSAYDGDEDEQLDPDERQAYANDARRLWPRSVGESDNPPFGSD